MGKYEKQDRRVKDVIVGMAIGAVKASGLPMVNELVLKNGSRLGNTIVNNYYNNEREAILRAGTKVNGDLHIRPKAGSWLAQIDLHNDAKLKRLNDFNLPISNGDLLGNLSLRLSDEILGYKNNEVRLAVNFSNIVKTLNNKTESATPSIDDNIHHRILTLPIVYDTLLESGFLNQQLNTEDEFLKPVYLQELSLDKLYDPEIKMLTITDYESDSYSTNKALELLKLNNAGEIERALYEYTLADLNAAIYALILVNDTLLNNTSIVNGASVSTVANKLIVFIRNTVGLFNTFETGGVVVIGCTLINKQMEILLLGTNYNKYIDAKGKLSVITGAVLSGIENMEEDFVYLRTDTVTLKTLTDKAEDFKAIKKTHQDALTLNNVNNAISRLRNNYLFGFDNLKNLSDKNSFYKLLESTVLNATLSELADVDGLVLKIVREFTIGKNNFDEFMVGVMDAKTTLDKNDVDTHVAYGAFRLALIYLAGQTTLV